MTDSDLLVKMANDIGHFFCAQPCREEAVMGMTLHIKSYWTKRMVQKLHAQIARGGVELDELPREALRRLRDDPALPRAAPGGDAG